MSEPAHVLVVAHQTAATEKLALAVAERAQRGPAIFHLVVPQQPHGMHKVVDPQDEGEGEAQRVLNDALPKLSEAAGSQVSGSVGDPEPLIDGRVDLGAIATEFLMLGIDPYPRKPDAAFEPPAAADDDTAHPFAALAALRKPSNRNDA